MPDLLYVCTGNRCRSPVADALTWKTLRDRGIQATAGSAGLLDGGVPLPVETRQVLAAYGIEPGKRVSQQVTAAMLAESEIVVGMDRGHVREICLLDPESWHHTFTLKDLVRRAEGGGPRRHGESMREWTDRLGTGRHTTEMLGASADDDIGDPMGLPYREHAQTATVIDDLVSRLVDLAWPEGPI